jgi:hypothetical protein
MDASLRKLLALAELPQEDYGWISEAVIQRRLRVPQFWAKCILSQVT